MKLFTRSELKTEFVSNLAEIQKKELAAAEGLKSKLIAFNNQEAELSQKIVALQNELKAEQKRFDAFMGSREVEVEILENRRLASLLPITKELEQLESKKIENDAYALLLSHKEEALLKKEQTLGQKDNELLVKQVAFNKETKETLEKIEAENKMSNSLISFAKSLEERASKREENLAEAERKIADREDKLNKTELTIRALMVSVDKRIELEKTEQAKTDEKRNMLAGAIAEFKKRGLWNNKSNTPLKKR